MSANNWFCKNLSLISQSTDDSEERINHLLKQFDSPDPIPPDITAANWTPPVAIIDVASLCEYKTVIDEIDQVTFELSVFFILKIF